MAAEWLPDWRGRAVAIVASGPTGKKCGVEITKDRLPVLAIKRSIELTPWAEVVYGCDYPWWRSVDGLPDFKGLKLAYDKRACDLAGTTKIDIEIKTDRLLFDEPGKVGSGGNSGFQALNIAVQAGASRVLLIAFDMHDRGGAHWFGRNSAVGQSNPISDNFRRWIAAYNVAAKQLEERGVDVVNASPNSDLKCFRKQDIETTLAEWGL